MASTTSLTNTAYIVLVGIIIASALVGFLVFRPMLSTIEDVQAEITQQESILQEKRDFIRTVNQQIALLRTQSQYEEQLHTVLPSDDRIQDVLQVIHQSAATHGVRVESISEVSAAQQNAITVAKSRGEDVTVPEDIDVVGMNATVVTTYASLRGFITDLERSPRLLDISFIGLKGNILGPDQISVTLLMTAYAE